MEGWVTKVEAFCCGRCSAWIMRESDTPEDSRIKRLATPVILSLFPFLIFLLLAAYARNPNTTSVTSLALFAVSFLQFLIRGCMGLSMRVSMDLFIGIAVVATMLLDAWKASELDNRTWSFSVLFLDAALVFNTPRTMPLVLAVTLVYLFVERLESGIRFGMYDVITSRTPPPCDCAKPPCATGFENIVITWPAFAIVLLVDFHLTRGFATDLRCQLRRGKASVEVAAEIAAALARYDVDAASNAITRGVSEDLPEELTDSYRLLLGNLLLYRPYLPAALFARGSYEECDEHDSDCCCDLGNFSDREATGCTREGSSLSSSRSADKGGVDATRLSSMSDLQLRRKRCTLLHVITKVGDGE
eukprot:Hpha_TRINITY_DN5970_c0_g1::TRINITY_DN5970_c0_g1_i1::g.147210::m.147210